MEEEAIINVNKNKHILILINYDYCDSLFNIYMDKEVYKDKMVHIMDFMVLDVVVFIINV